MQTVALFCSLASVSIACILSQCFPVHKQISPTRFLPGAFLPENCPDPTLLVYHCCQQAAVECAIPSIINHMPELVIWGSDLPFFPQTKYGISSRTHLVCGMWISRSPSVLQRPKIGGKGLAEPRYIFSKWVLSLWKVLDLTALETRDEQGHFIKILASLDIVCLRVVLYLNVIGLVLYLGEE